jgi:tetratricopeptide (TPR) repeat protein
MIHGMRRVWVASALIATAAIPCFGDTTPKPLGQMRLMALVAGNVVPETVMQEISADGIAFHPSETYRAQLKNAGATDAELAALSTAKIVVTDPRSETANAEALQHLSDAAAAMRKGAFEEAASQLKAVLDATMSNSEAGFVMGEVLRRQERWADAQIMYEAVLAGSPDCRDAHTKRSFIFYKLGDADNALIEAKAALEEMPNDAEAHKNAGLALQSMRKFDAAAAEYQAALHVKPDYESVHNDFGNVLNDKGDVDGAIVEYRKAIALDPNEEDAHYNLGVALAEKGELDTAVVEYREAIKLKPTFHDAWENMAGVLEKSARWQEAVDTYREMLRLFPDSAI